MCSSDFAFHGRLACLTRRMAAMLAALCLTLSLPAFGQEDEAEDAAAEDAAEEELSGPVEEVIVTGSRLRRSTYTSVAPLQIISAEVKREAGLIDAGDILQESTAAAGVQIDLTFNGFVLDDGPGTVTANLRGLGASRTLVLLNGRRMAPSGVEGAPTSPDLGIVPGLMIEQYDQLLDGASSVYGSDAVAGVINAILRKDFDGFTLQALPSFPSHSKGRELAYAASWGRNFDRGFIGIGAQYLDTEPITYADRPWTAGCMKHWEIDEGGRVRHQDLVYSTTLGMRWNECALDSLVGRVSVPRAGSIYYTPGGSNGGWPDFSETNLYGFGVDADGDGETDLTYQDYDLNGRTQFAHLRSDRQVFSAIAYGEYTFEGEYNLTPFFETLYASRELFTDNGVYQLFPTVPAGNPFNICNPNGAGVDCGLAWDALLTNPNFIAQFGQRFAGFCASRGIPASACTPATFGQLSGPIGPAPVTPITTVRGDRTLVTTSTNARRWVGGVRGDLPFMNMGTLTDWSFEFSITYSKSDSLAFRPGIREDRLDLALGAYSTTNTPCVNDTGTAMAHDTAAGCVPVNMFAPSLYSPLIGGFGTQAEHDYVFDNRDFTTIYEQTVTSFYASGTLFELPAGQVAGGVGFEHRVDEIASVPDHVARDGLMFGFFSDGGAIGDRRTQEVFGEVEAPLLGNLTAVEDLTVNLSARLTDDEYYGSAWTGAAKIGWRPIDSLLIRSTWGTSYRAPNLRELFLQPQTGFASVFDPCLIPDAAIDPISGGYNPALDRREDYVLANCRAHGVDPTVASNNGLNFYFVEAGAGGTLDLEEETSKSWSFGFAFEQPFTNLFSMTVGMSYYEVEIDDTIIEPVRQFIVNSCYATESPVAFFCDRIRRLDDPEAPLIDYLDRGFVNRDNETVRGVDVNISLDTTVTLLERAVDLSFETNLHRLIERTEIFVNDNGEVDIDTDHRDWFFPEHDGDMALRLAYGRWSVNWSARYIGDQDDDPDGVEEFDDISGNSSTCLGPPDDVLCRDVDYAGDYWLHRASVGYAGDSWDIRVGARNVFDTPPPKVDWSEAFGFTVNNTVIGGTYDIRGRYLFLVAEYTFGDGI